MLRIATRVGSSERGSVIIGISALMLVLLLGTALIARSQLSLQTVDSDTGAMIAQAGAEQAVAEVLARIDAGESGDFSDSGSFGDSDYQYSAEEVSDTEYFVTAEAEADGQRRAIAVTIGGDGETPYTLFVDSSASIEDNLGTISGLVATNGDLSVTGTTLGDVVNLHGSDASCDNCPSVNVFPDALDVPFPAVPTGPTRPCPSDGIFTGIVDGLGGVPFVCTTSDLTGVEVQLTGTVTVANPPLVLHVLTGLDFIARDASVNATGESEDLQVYGHGDDNYWWFDVWNSSVRGVLYAPGRDSRLQSASIEGTVSVGLLSVYDTHNASIAPASTVVDRDYLDWTVTSWERVPAS